MKSPRFAKNNKGVSPLFIAIYIALLSVLLISTLFSGLVVSRAGLAEYLKIEQERMQESILISRLEPSSSGFVQHIQVNNTGAITVRIGAIYVDGNLIWNQSRAKGDAYISPGGHLNIDLSSHKIPFDTALNALWTVTTERGTRSSKNWTEDDGFIPDKFYFGPLMILFDWFHWRSGNGPWKDGWSIPNTATDVAWRILLANADDRPIVLSKTSHFVLVQNAQQQQKAVIWFVNPDITKMTLLPGRYYFVYFTASGNNNLNLLQTDRSCINFLVFNGNLTDSNGNPTSFGQTIPFEAVIITDEKMVASITLTANPANIRNDGTSTSTITAKITDSGGNPLANIWVDFYTSSGTLSETRKQTDANGIAQVTLTSSTLQTTASVVATSQGVTGNCNVTFTPASRIAVTAEPTMISRNGGTSRITVQLVDSSNRNVTQPGIIITVSISSWTGRNPLPTLTNATYTGSSVMVTTDSKGSANVTLTAYTQGRAGIATITASASGLSSGSTTVQVQ